MSPKKHEFEHDVKMDVEARVRQGVKAVLEVLEEEMVEHLQAGYRELTPTRRGASWIDRRWTYHGPQCEPVRSA